MSTNAKEFLKELAKSAVQGFFVALGIIIAKRLGWHNGKASLEQSSIILDLNLYLCVN